MGGHANFHIGVAEHEGNARSDDVTVSVFRAVKLLKELETGGKVVANAMKAHFRVLIEMIAE